MEVEHVVPRCRGGTDEASNLKWACGLCNKSKKDRTLEEWRTYLWLRLEGMPRQPEPQRRWLLKRAMDLHCESAGAARFAFEGGDAVERVRALEPKKGTPIGKRRVQQPIFISVEQQ